MKKCPLISLMLFISIVSLYGHDVSFPPAIVSAGGNSVVALSPVRLRWRTSSINVLTLPVWDFDLKNAAMAVVPGDQSADWSAVAYPNPVADFLKVRFRSEIAGEYTLVLSDVTGRKIFTRKTGTIVNGQTEVVDMTGFVTGIYFLNITVANQTGSRLFKIAKN